MPIRGQNDPFEISCAPRSSSATTKDRSATLDDGRFDIVEARDGDEALELLRSGRPETEALGPVEHLVKPVTLADLDRALTAAFAVAPVPAEA